MGAAGATGHEPHHRVAPRQRQVCSVEVRITVRLMPIVSGARRRLGFRVVRSWCRNPPAAIPAFCACPPRGKPAPARGCAPTPSSSTMRPPGMEKNADSGAMSPTGSFARYFSVRIQLFIGPPRPRIPPSVPDLARIVRRAAVTSRTLWHRHAQPATSRHGHRAARAHRIGEELIAARSDPRFNRSFALRRAKMDGFEGRPPRLSVADSAAPATGAPSGHALFVRADRRCVTIAGIAC